MAKKKVLSEDELELPIADLLPIVTLLEKFTTQRDISPALKHLWFSKDTLRASAGEAAGLWQTPWTFPGDFSLPAATFVKLISSLRDQGHENVTLQLKANMVVVKSAGFRAQMSLYAPAENENPEDYINREPPAEDGRLAVTADWWKDLDRIAFTIGKDETKAMLRGVFWAPNSALFASDTYRISLVVPEAAARVAPPDKAGLLIPDHLLSRIASRRKDVTEVAVEGGTLWLFFDAGAVSGSLLSAAFPVKSCMDLFKDVQTKLNAKQGTTVVLPEGAPMLVALDRLLYFADPPSYRLRVTITKDTMTLAVGGTDGESSGAEETVPVQVSGPPMTLAMNGKFLREAVEAVGNTFWVGSAEATTMYLTSKDKRLHHLIMLLSNEEASNA